MHSILVFRNIENNCNCKCLCISLDLTVYTGINIALNEINNQTAYVYSELDGNTTL